MSELHQSTRPLAYVSLDETPQQSASGTLGNVKCLSAKPL